MTPLTGLLQTVVRAMQLHQFDAGGWRLLLANEGRASAYEQCGLPRLPDRGTDGRFSK